MRRTAQAAFLVTSCPTAPGSGAGWPPHQGGDQGIFLASAAIPGVIGFSCGAMPRETAVSVASVPGADPSDTLFGRGSRIVLRAEGPTVFDINQRCTDGSFVCPPNAFRRQNSQAVRLP
jgi:hypothetical protein